MNTRQIAKSRILSQRVSGDGLETEKAVIEWMTAIQAQDFEMAKWGIGIRMRAATELSVQAAIDSGKILRTHLLRPTWHFVSAQDIRWLIELTSPQIRNTLRARHKGLELTDAVVTKSNKIIARALTRARYLTREELMTELERGGLSTQDNRASHFFLRAELDKIICSGPTRKGRPTYAFFDERVPRAEPLEREEALGRLAVRYFASRYPATLQDFTWWSGLRVKDAKKALEMNKTGFYSERINSKTYWFPNSTARRSAEAESAQLLPTFDEILLSYRDRSASLVQNDRIKTISNNGIFRPTVVVNGQIIGVWRRSIEGSSLNIRIELFQKARNELRNHIVQATKRYAQYMEKTPKISWGQL